MKKIIGKTSEKEKIIDSFRSLSYSTKEELYEKMFFDEITKMTDIMNA